MAYGRDDVCEHGSLERKCEICFRDKRIAELEKQIRIWRDDYAHSPDGVTVAIPVYQLSAALGENS